MIDNAYARSKNRRKTIRVIFQIVLILGALWLLLGATILKPTYKVVPDTSKRQRDKGFIALSYFGVSYDETETLISQERLNDHLRALRDAGYVTISQQDVLDYYLNGKSLPDKALFLFFEDGRKESSMLAQRSLEDFNFLASMLTYGNNLETYNQLFLSGRDLKSLESSTFWELGTNGYRLSYINVFDRHENYLGEMTPSEFFLISPYTKREYNHYLMDFLRDQYDIPMESHAQMQQRIAEDYALMHTVYVDKLGKLPQLYAIMHANTGQFATHNQVSLENEHWIGEYFTMNFNREMYSVNDLSCDPYDLTRMQPQAYWSTNHLLMRIIDDTGESLPFVIGNEKKAADWTILKGAAEFTGNQIWVTSLPESDGRIRLKHSDQHDEFTVSVRLKGNKLGMQAIDLLSDETADQYTAVEVKNNHLLIYTVDGETLSEPLFDLDLDVHDGVVHQTWEENRQEAMGIEIEAKKKQMYKPEESLIIVETLIRNKAITTGANNEPYIPEITLKDAGDRLLEMTVKNGALSVSIDGKTAVSGLESPYMGGGLALRASWNEYGYSQRNLADDVYDGVFESLYITTPNGTSADDPTVIYDNREEYLSPIVEKAKELWDGAVEWTVGFFDEL